MNLFNMIKNIEYKILQGNDKEISHITIDSRNIRKNTLFVCIQGLNIDGHNFIKMAVSEGAIALIIDRDIENINEEITVIKVKNSRKALSYIAANFYCNPIKECRLIGVTGTNGKTSTTYFMESILKENGNKTGIIGTIGIKCDGINVEIDFSTSTTPDSIELQKILKYMVVNKVDDVIMEVSSHALELYKLEGFQFETSIFTNLTQDHLDLHGNMENYRNAKSKLFKMSKNSIINIDDNAGDFMIKKALGNIITFSIDKESDLKAYNIFYSSNGVSFDLKIDNLVHNFYIPIPGKFSVYNALGVIGASISLNISIDIVKNALKNLKGVPGRIQNIENNMGFSVIVDYAHTPDGLENIINTVKNYTLGRIITVFGCGGDRDRIKRPIMGEIVGKLSDICVITSDNPRTEDPYKILDEIEVGIRKFNDKYIKIVDRRKAIEYAINNANKDDAIIIAGKGHEDYQVFAKETIYFDDVQVAKEILSLLNRGKEENKK